MPASPMMAQYWEVKNQHKDYLVFFRLGDFYEMFYDDARLASKELELTLTGRDCGEEERAPMCGVPYHSCEGYIARLLAKGYRVAICEQTEDPALAKGLVKREVIRLITPSTVTETSMLDEGKNNFLAAVCFEGGLAGLAFVEVSTGAVHVTETEDGLSGISNELVRFSPRELLAAPGLPKAFLKGCTSLCNAQPQPRTADDFDYYTAMQRISAGFSPAAIQKSGIEKKPLAAAALGAALGYLEEVYKGKLTLADGITVYSGSRFMQLDIYTRRNLELVETLRSQEKRGSLLWLLDHTKTPMGRRLLRSFLERPLLDCGLISKRQNAVGELVTNEIRRSELMSALSGIYDMERITTRVLYGSANGRELKLLSGAIAALPAIHQGIAGFESVMMREIQVGIDPLEDIYALIQQGIVDEPPFSVREGGLIRAGYSPEVDHLRMLVNDSQQLLAKIEADEKEKTGIKGLKVGYNRVYGYYIEITKSYLANVPDSYIRKQTLTNCERYITPELKELEGEILDARSRLVELEYDLFCKIRGEVALAQERIRLTAASVALLDVFCSFAEVAEKQGYCRPDVDVSGKLRIVDGRHPVVEATLASDSFIPNSTDLDCGENRMMILTGPNMAGKSTYMRQTALIVLMAQIGSFVPAASAEIGVADGIYTRIGASDDLSAGQSTFMVEMNELSYILKNATKDSLIILDEIGRGTSTFDGMSIARAVIEYIADKKKVGAKTLFATHYHELCEMEGQIEGVKNYNILVRKRGDEITFLRKIARGGADDSYGIEVAKLAGVPDGVIKRAKQVLAELEADSKRRVYADAENRPAYADGELQTGLSDDRQAGLLQKLKNIDINTLTPMEALSILDELGRAAKTL